MDISSFKLLRSFLLVSFMTVMEYKRGSFTISGSVTGFIICLLIAYSNIVFLFVMTVFVLSGSFVTRYKFELKQSKMIDDEQKIETKKYKKSARNHIQVLCNGGLACIYATLYCWKTGFSGISLPIGHEHDSSIYSIGYVFTTVCCCGDTFASELGPILAKNNPRLITNPFRVVPIGTNGGVTLAGFLVSMLGGFVTGLGYVIGNLMFCQTHSMTNTVMMNVQILLYCTLFGLLGSVIDSLLGATLQYSGFDRERNVTVQKPGPSIERISGLNILSNNQVNLISSFLTSIIAMWTLSHILL